MPSPGPPAAALNHVGLPCWAPQANNRLTGTLPAWTRRGAWRVLETLDLSNNLYYGA